MSSWTESYTMWAQRFDATSSPHTTVIQHLLTEKYLAKYTVYSPKHCPLLSVRVSQI